MIRTIPTGDLGLDLLLGGGWRLVTRYGKQASATVLVRGGPGAGKSLVGLQAALALARALGGDVAVGCVEILPTEYFAQIVSSRPDIPRASVVVLPGTTPHEATPRIYCGLLTDLDPNAPDLVGSLEALARDIESAGGKPVVFVVDSLIEGYGLGSSTARASADAVMKLAAQGGYGLVLCEESHGEGGSPWAFAADTVVDLGVEARERGRWIEARKHRFGPSVSGRHELDLGEQGPPAVYPEPHAWVTIHHREVLRAHGWDFDGGQEMPALVWDAALQATPQEARVRGTFVLVTSDIEGLAREVSAALRPEGNAAAPAMVIELDPLLLRDEVVSDDRMDVLYVPTVHGPARALRALVERFAAVASKERKARPARVLVGNLGLVLEARDALGWVEAVHSFASLVIETGVPVIAHATTDREMSAATVLKTYPDVHVKMVGVGAVITERWQKRQQQVGWQALQNTREPLFQLPRPRGR